MCLACEQGDQERVWELIEIISHGKMPPWHSAEELRAMGLPLPGELYREEQPDGTITIKQRSPTEIKALHKANPFTCDAPE
jgi:hypothetical protein